jgi:hypothetical protein
MHSKLSADLRIESLGMLKSNIKSK